MKYIVFFALLGLFIWNLDRINQGYDHYCYNLKTVAEVGGCGKYDCGVRFTDGSFGEVRNPVPGMSKCFSYEPTQEWRWF